eukprot:3554053-Rhodomonas_salina.1
MNRTGTFPSTFYSTTLPPFVWEQHMDDPVHNTTFECDRDPVDPIPCYKYDELEEWTSHLTLAKRHNIHWVCLQSPSLAETLKTEQLQHAAQTGQHLRPGPESGTEQDSDFDSGGSEYAAGHEPHSVADNDHCPAMSAAAAAAEHNKQQHLAVDIMIPLHPMVLPLTSHWHSDCARNGPAGGVP